MSPHNEGESRGIRCQITVSLSSSLSVDEQGVSGSFIAAVFYFSHQQLQLVGGSDLGSGGDGDANAGPLL